MTAELIHRLHFAFTVTFHYLFPSSRWGCASDRVLKSVALRTGSEEWDRAARFWAASSPSTSFSRGHRHPHGVRVWHQLARFSRISGGVIGQPLAMEGVFSFFLESAFLGLFLYGEKRLSKRMHWLSAVMVWLGSWISGFFIIVTDAWMQHLWPTREQPTGNSRCSAFGNCC